MGALTVTRVLLSRILFTPAGLVSVLLLLSAQPVLLVVAPSGISSSHVLPQQWSYELSFVGQAVGTVLGLAVRERIEPLLARDRTGARLAGDWLAFLACGMAGASIPLLPGLALTRCGVTSMLGDSVGEFLLSLATIATAAAALVRLRTVPGLAPWLLASGIVFAPMVLPTPVSPRASILLTGGFALAAWLLDHPPTLSARSR